MKHRPLAVVLAVGLALAAACGGGGGDEPSQGQGSQEVPSSQPETTQAGGGQAGGEGQAGGGGRGPRTIAFVPPGPSDPDTPVGNQWYDQLTRGECQQVLNLVRLAGVERSEQADVVIYRGAARACLGQWSEAEADFKLLTNNQLPFSEKVCGRRLAFEWFKTLIMARRADPGFTPRFVRAAPRPPCRTGSSTTATSRPSGGTTRTTSSATTSP